MWRLVTGTGDGGFGAGERPPAVAELVALAEPSGKRPAAVARLCRCRQALLMGKEVVTRRGRDGGVCRGQSRGPRAQW